MRKMRSADSQQVGQGFVFVHLVIASWSAKGYLIPSNSRATSWARDIGKDQMSVVKRYGVSATVCMRRCDLLALQEALAVLHRSTELVVTSRMRKFARTFPAAGNSVQLPHHIAECHRVS